MFVGRLATRRIKMAVVVVAVYMLVAALLARFFPANGTSFQEAYLRWLLGIPASLLLWAFLEWSGEKALNQQFWSRMPSGARVVLLALILVALGVAVIGINAWWQAKSAA